MNVTYTCPTCGSRAVHIRTWTQWDIDTQQWLDDDDDPHAQAGRGNCNWEGTFFDLIEIPT